MERRFKSVCHKEYRDTIVKNRPPIIFNEGSIYDVLYMDESEFSDGQSLYLISDGVDTTVHTLESFPLYFYTEYEMRERNINSIINEG
jgi:hypothetical protein